MYLATILPLAGKLVVDPARLRGNESRPIHKGAEYSIIQPACGIQPRPDSPVQYRQVAEIPTIASIGPWLPRKSSLSITADKVSDYIEAKISPIS